MSASRGVGAGFGGSRATCWSGFSAPEAATHGWPALAPQVGQSRAGGRRRFVVFGMDGRRLACYGARMPDKSKRLTWGQAVHACARLMLAGVALAVVVFVLRYAWRLGGAL